MFGGIDIEYLLIFFSDEQLRYVTLIDSDGKKFVKLPYFETLASFKKFLLLHPRLVILSKMATGKPQLYKYLNKFVVKLYFQFCDLLENSYNQRIEIIRKFYNLLKPFYQQYVAFEPNLDKFDDQKREFILRNRYGGLQFHISSNYLEPYSEKQYYDHNNNPPQTFSQQVAITDAINDINSISQTHIDSNTIHKVAPLFVRSCDINCHIPNNWANNVYKLFKCLSPKVAFTTVAHSFIALESCKHTINTFGQYCGNYILCAT